MQNKLILAAVSLLVLFIGLGSTRLLAEDEGYFASCAAEMYARGDAVTPMFNGDMFGHKPALMYWGMMAGFAAVGVNETGARLFAACFGLATVATVYAFGRRLFNERAGFYAAIAIATAVFFNIVSRAATPDTALSFFALLALYLFAKDGFLQPGEFNPYPRSWRTWAGIYATLGFAVLTKGPIGLLFPMAVIGLFLLCMTPVRSPRWFDRVRPFLPVNFVFTVWRMRPLTALAIVAAVAGPWYLAVQYTTQGKFLHEFIFVHNLHRASHAMDNHSGPFFYYPLSVVVGMFPWSIFAVPAGLLWVSRLRTPSPVRPALVLLSCWAGVYLVIFSIPSTKLPNYVLPMYPAVALAVGYFIDTWLTDAASVSRSWLRGSWLSLIAVGLIVAVGLPLSGSLEFDGRTLLDRLRVARDVQGDLVWLSVLGLPLAFGGMVVWLLAETGRRTAAVNALCVTAVANLLVLWLYAAPRVDRFQSPQELAQGLRGETRKPGEIGQYGYFRPSMVFYAGDRIEPCDDEEAATAFLAHEGRVLITLDEHYDRIKSRLPNDVVVLAERPRFPKEGRILLLGREGNGRLASRPRP